MPPNKIVLIRIQIEKIMSSFGAGIVRHSVFEQEGYEQQISRHLSTQGDGKRQKKLIRDLVFFRCVSSHLIKLEGWTVPLSVTLWVKTFSTYPLQLPLPRRPRWKLRRRRLHRPACGVFRRPLACRPARRLPASTTPAPAPSERRINLVSPMSPLSTLR